MFLFRSTDEAATANAGWWQNQRIILPAYIIKAIQFGVFDASHLDAPRERWKTAARSYWTGETGGCPRKEVLVNGIVQLQGWEPFAKLLGPMA